MTNLLGTPPQTNDGLEAFLLKVTDVVNTTLDLDTLLRRVAELVRNIIPYEIFAILLLNEKTQEMRFRFALGHSPEFVERARVKMGVGVTGMAAARGEPVLVNDVDKSTDYIAALPQVRSELAVPLILKGQVIGVIDIEANQRGYFTDEHSRILTLVASRVAVGVENARLYTRVSRQAKTLQLLNEISRELTAILNVDELLKRIAEALTRLIDYQMFSILLLDSTGTRLEHRFSVRFKENIHLKHSIKLGEGLVGYAAENKEPLLVPDVTKDKRYIALNPETRSELCVPLIHKGMLMGVLDLEHTRKRYYTDEHLRTVSTLAAQIAVAIENATLYEKIARQEQALEHDLALARELQFRLLPASAPHLKNAEIATKFQPAQAIGGDLYDFVKYPPEDGSKQATRLGIGMGDVSGKGPAAALYAALVSGFLRSHAVERPGPAEMLRLINQSLMERRVDAQYVTMTYAIWDDEKRILQVANSGLPRPLYCRQGHTHKIEAAGLPLGLFDSVQHDELTFQAEPNDIFVFFSDGILDASDRNDVLFGRVRLEEVVRENSERSAKEIRNAINSAVIAHSAGSEQFDDQTLLVMKVHDNPTGSTQ